MQRGEILRFLLLFAILSCGGFVALQSPRLTPLLWQLKLWTSSVVAAGVSALGTPAVADGSHVRFAGTWLRIIDECTGVYAGVLLLAFVVAFPHPWRRRAVAIAFGLAAVTLLNLLRLITLAWLMVHRPGAADFAHDYLWQAVWAGALVGFALLFTRRPTLAT